MLAFLLFPRRTMVERPCRYLAESLDDFRYVGGMLAFLLFPRRTMVERPSRYLAESLDDFRYVGGMLAFLLFRAERWLKGHADILPKVLTTSATSYLIKRTSG